MKKDIVAKLRCDFVDNRQHGTEIVHFNAVTSGSEENRSFASATPAAHLEITITNPEALGAFKAGAEYYLTFVEADGKEEQEEEQPAGAAPAPAAEETAASQVPAGE